MKTWTAGEKVFAADLNGNFAFIKSVIPSPPFPVSGLASIVGTDTLATIGQIFIPAAITVNKISVLVSSYASTQTLNIAIYSEDGQTKLTSGSISMTGNGLFTITLGAPVTFNAGIYYIATSRPTATAGALTMAHATAAGTTTTPAGKPVQEGTIAISSGTLPATINPASITYSASKAALVRLDN